MIREARKADASIYKGLIESLESESDFLLFGQGERVSTIEQVQGLLMKVTGEENSIIFLSEKEEGVMGHVTVFGGGAPRNRHVGSVITGVLEKAQGSGLAQTLFSCLFEWAVEKGISRLELTVMVHNERAVNFYERMGFEKEGIKKQSLVVHGTPVDEYMMAKILI